MNDQLDRTSARMLRNILGVSWKEHKTNGVLQKAAGCDRIIVVWRTMIYSVHL